MPEFLRQVDPRAFEALVCKLYERMGYSVEPTRYVGDDGVDGYLRKDGKLTILQCKRTKSAIGAPILRDVLGAMHHDKADAAIVVTTGGVSRQARRWAVGTPIRIIQLPELVEMLKCHLREEDIVPDDFAVGEERFCAKCGMPLREVQGRRGRFLGCTGYPVCRYTRDLGRRRSTSRRRVA
jgi:restriction system protein